MEPIRESAELDWSGEHAGLIPPIAETDSHQGRMIRLNRARRARQKTAAAPPEAPQPISEAYDIKNVDFRNLLTVAVGTLSNQTGESFDSAILRGKCADEILRRYEQTRASAEQLAANVERLANWITRNVSTQDTEAMLYASEAKKTLAQWEAGK